MNIIDKIILKIINLIPITNIRRNYRNRYYAHYYEPQIKNIEKNHLLYRIISLPIELGASTMICSLFKEFKKRNNGKLLVITKNKSVADYVKHFSEVDEVLIKSNDFIQYAEKKENDFENNILGKFFNPMKGYKNPLTIFSKIENYFQYILTLMQIDGDFELTFPTYDLGQEKILKEKYNLDKMTILLSPEANSLNPNILSCQYWIELANVLSNQGYNVIINALNKNYGENYLYTSDESIYNMLLISKFCKNIIAFRSGLTDVLAANAINNMYVYYPTADFQMYKDRKNSKMNKFFNVNSDIDLEKVVNKGQSLKAMYNNNIYEKWIRQEDLPNLLNDVISYIENYNTINEGKY